MGSGFPALVPQEKVLFLAILIRPLLTKLVQSRWLNIGLVDPFLRFAKMSLSQYPAILTSTWSITHIYMHNKNPLEFAVLAGTSEWKLTDTQLVLYHTSRAQSAVHGLGKL